MRAAARSLFFVAVGLFWSRSSPTVGPETEPGSGHVLFWSHRGTDWFARNEIISVDL